MRTQAVRPHPQREEGALTLNVFVEGEAPTCVTVIAHPDTQAVFEALCNYTDEHPIPPSLHQIAKACQLSPRVVPRHLKQLRREGYHHRELLAHQQPLPENTQAVGEAILRIHDTTGHPPTLAQLAHACHLSVLTIRHHLRALRQRKAMVTFSQTAQTRMETIYRFLEDYLDEHGYAPSVREITAGCGMKSTSHARSYLLKLEQQGRIIRTPHHARALRLVR